MLENNLENKAKFYAQHYGQKIATISIVSDRKTGLEKLQTASVGLGFASLDSNIIKFITLKPVSAISEEDKISLGVEGATSFDEYGYSNTSWSADQIDDLRAMGYLVGWRGITTQEILNRGWAVLEQPDSK